MKKIITISVLAFACGRLPAAKFCAVGGTWSTDTSLGGDYSGGAYAFTGAGNLDGSPTWAIQNNYGVKVRGRHACINTDWGGATPTGTGFAGYPAIAAKLNLTGYSCYCQRTLVNGITNVGNWVLMMDLGTPAKCSEKCGYYCAWNLVSFGYNAALPSVLFGVATY